MKLRRKSQKSYSFGFLMRMFNFFEWLCKEDEEEDFLEDIIIDWREEEEREFMILDGIVM